MNTSFDLAKRIRISLACTSALLMFLPQICFAHVKWFAEESQTITPYSFTEPVVIIWIILSAIILGCAYWYQHHSKVPDKIVKLGNQHYSTINHIAMTLIGLWPIITLLDGHILLPTVPLHSPLSFAGLLLLVTGISAIWPVTRRYCGIGFIALWIYILSHLGMLNAMEHLFIVGIGLGAFWLTQGKEEFLSRALPIIRSLTGFSLVLLAFREKLLVPGLAQTFMSEHPQFNVPKLLGVTWFDDRLFILSTGMIELLLGIMIMLGLCTRLNTLFLGGAFIATAAALGPQEVLGHLPLFGIAVWLLVYGHDESSQVHYAFHAEKSA